ncbi:hypothetical protein T11_17543 [Trichinella zimbabwensis]|uniref:Uncharacterized protein n=1 Tax=Trichinella zimbabwensis TaxID=268475 RepID=A0A0V1I7L5_9BILA|nr:hypothetical protein T11_17543 [Trichinella zimbabwensis]
MVSFRCSVKALENAKQNFKTHPITRRTFSQLETLAHRLDKFLNEYLPKAADVGMMSSVSSILRRECNAQLICQIYDAPFVT